jgi:hypothetical protein
MTVFLMSVIWTVLYLRFRKFTRILTAFWFLYLVIVECLIAKANEGSIMFTHRGVTDELFAC